jgi:transitional endoplasmic reticulum ATPase
MLRTITLYRRRSARRGRGLADFAIGFALTGIFYVFTGAWRLGSWLMRSLVAAVRVRLSFSRDRIANRVRDSRKNMPMSPKQGPYAEFTPIAERPTTCFHDIAGLEDAKRQIYLRMILPALHPEKARLYGVRQGGGILFYGPPGTGKTMLARAAANQAGFPLFSIKPADIMSGTVGEAEGNVVRLFETVRRHRPSVLFIDEIEGLMPCRRHNGSTISQRVVSAFLSETDGLLGRADGVLLLGASNEPDRIDPAMRRPGRFDSLIHCGLPDSAARRMILTNNLAGRPTTLDMYIDDLASRTEGLSGAELCELVNKAAERAFYDSISRLDERPVDAEDFEAALLKIRQAQGLSLVHVSQ